MAEPVVDHQKRFQAAVEVIQSLPKNGSYRPSSDVMLRFYSLYKQAVVGPCLAPRPSFWDPVGRYKWDAWSRLGDMSRDIAMETYVEEMKKVAAEVIGTMPMNEKTASLFHYFEPLYQVIQDMPRPPQALLSLREAVGDSDQTHSQSEEEEADFVKEMGMEGRDPPADQEVSEKLVLTSTLNDSGLGEGLLLLSDSESEIFCDSVDSVDLLNTNKVEVKGRHTHPESPRVLSQHLEAVAETMQVGAGQGGEWGRGEQGAPEGRERSEDAGRDGAHHRWREGVVSPGSPRQAQERGDGSPGRGGGAREEGGDREEGGAKERQDVPLQQHIAAALKTLRQDMKNVIERLEAVEKLAAHAPCAEGRGCLRCYSASERQDKRWPFDVSGRTLLLLLLWPLAAHGLILLLERRRGPRGGRIASS